MSQLATRNEARRLFPGWSRRMKAKWVLAKLKADSVSRVIAISAHWPHDRAGYRFQRGRAIA